MVFTEDLKFGESYQKKLLNIIEYDTCEIAPPRRFSDWDVKINYKNEETLFEVKADKLTSKTNNICIEFNCNNKPSGIETTKSDFYAYFDVFNDILYMIPTKSIKRRIKKKLYHKCINGGDGGRCRLYLFKTSIFDKFKFI